MSSFNQVCNCLYCLDSLNRNEKKSKPTSTTRTLPCRSARVARREMTGLSTNQRRVRLFTSHRLVQSYSSSCVSLPVPVHSNRSSWSVPVIPSFFFQWEVCDCLPTCGETGRNLCAKICRQKHLHRSSATSASRRYTSDTLKHVRTSHSHHAR